MHRPAHWVGGCAEMRNGLPARVLLVEDDPDARDNLRDILELDGHVIDEAATVAEASDREDWSVYSLVLLDRRLPDGTGVDLLPELKRLAPAADVIILTGLSDVEGAIQALRQGAVDYLLKPINPDELRTRVARLIERRRADAELRRRSFILQSVVSQVDDAAIVVDRCGKVLLHSPAVERLFGPIRAGSAIQESLAVGRILRADASTPYALADLPLSRALRGHVVIDEEIYIKPFGGLSGRWMSAHAAPLRDGDGIQGAVVILRDITERKEAQARALQAERLAAIGIMVTGLAHESRNALQRSQACLEMLALELPDRPRAQDLLARLQKAQDELARVYEGVRNYAAPIQLERTRLQPRRCLADRLERAAAGPERAGGGTSRNRPCRGHTLPRRSVPHGAGLPQLAGECGRRLSRPRRDRDRVHVGPIIPNAARPEDLDSRQRTGVCPRRGETSLRGVFHHQNERNGAGARHRQAHSRGPRRSDRPRGKLSPWRRIPPYSTSR